MMAAQTLQEDYPHRSENNRDPLDMKTYTKIYSSLLATALTIITRAVYNIKNWSDGLKQSHVSRLITQSLRNDVATTTQAYSAPSSQPAVQNASDRKPAIWMDASPDTCTMGPNSTVSSEN